MTTISLAIPSSFADLFPYYEGINNLKAARDGTQKILIAPGICEDVPLSLIGRVADVIVGILLIVPIVNTVVLILLQQINSSHLSPLAKWRRSPLIQLSFTPAIDVPVPETALTPQELAARKTQALARLAEIENRGDNQESAFLPDTSILSFDLDAILQRYQTDQLPSRLCDFLDWAGIQDRGKINNFHRAVSRLDHPSFHDSQSSTAKKLLSATYGYFTERRGQIAAGSPAEGELKAQFQTIVDRVIDANRGCVDQMLSQLQGMMLDIIADGYATSHTGRQLAIIKLRAGLTLCQYRSNLIKEIFARQNPGEYHQADVERMIVQRLAPALGMQGEVFSAGAYYRFESNELQAKAANVLNAFFQEYKPLHYLASELRTYHGNARKLRNELLMWTNDHFKTADEVEDPSAEATAPAPIRLNMDRRMSEDFDTLPMHDGGNLTPAATLFLLEAAGLIRPRM